MKQRSMAQQKALERYPNAKRFLNDFSMAQGYAACYQERVEPLLKLLEDAKRVLSYIPEPHPHLELLEKMQHEFEGSK